MSSTDLPLAAQSVFAMLDPEVWIVTAADGNRRGGLVATWVKQASIDPDAPSLAIAVDNCHFTSELISASGAFAAHLIRSDQLDLVWRFAIGSGRDRDKLADLELTSGQTGSPLLADCLASLECKIYDSKNTGDRTYFWADVVAGQRFSDEPPLCQQQALEAAEIEQLHQLRDARLADIELQRPLRQAYRKGLK